MPLIYIFAHNHQDIILQRKILMMITLKQEKGKKLYDIYIQKRYIHRYLFPDKSSSHKKLQVIVEKISLWYPPEVI